MRSWKKVIIDGFWYCQSDEKIPHTILCGSEVHAESMQVALNRVDMEYRYPLPR